MKIKLKVEFTFILQNYRGPISLDRKTFIIRQDIIATSLLTMMLHLIFLTILHHGSTFSKLALISHRVWSPGIHVSSRKIYFSTTHHVECTAENYRTNAYIICQRCT